MDNPEKLATLGTQDTGRRQTKQKNTTQKAVNRNKTLHFYLFIYMVVVN